ncbi:MAG: hypothetical protein KatS3mg111_1479 [Pirellulaceae bacterium]|nr:MAG: hypothetical protein KatS3mg111_1479 [Pirellulaceae bacterium]
MDGSAFAAGFGAGMGAGIATGIAIGMSSKKSTLEQLKSQLDDAIREERIQVTDANGNAVTAAQLIAMLQPEE